ncbi:hypothetical protein ABIE37_003123 [Arthrobacter bambusae]|uniref:RiboL-PSP-HEPN domain-containing protein n=1 Tax=Arthrobacter bambusae TaxID=1338426 RepID=A0ABV2P967_9MICC
MSSLSLVLVRAKFAENISSAVKILDLGEDSLTQANGSEENSLSRESRGLCMVLLFAGYEQLLKATCREVLEHLKMQSGRVADLHTGYRTLALARAWQSMEATTKTEYWNVMSDRFVSGLYDDVSTINANEFPNDGSFMDRSQVTLVCNLFGFDDIHKVLGRTWDDLSQVRRRRNKVAHGEATAAEVGRDFTYAEAVDLVGRWDTGWNAFLDCVERTIASGPDHFFRSSHARNS